MSRSLSTLAALALLVPFGAAAETEVPVYPGAPHVRIGKDIQIDRELFRIAYFTTPDPVDKVARYFLEKWTEEGLPTFVDRTPDDRDVVVSAFYTREGLMRSVVLRRHDKESTVGFTVLKDLWTKVAAPERQGLVTLEGSLYASDVSYSDRQGGAAHRSIILQRSFQDTYAEVRARMSRAGFKLTRETGQKVDGKQQVVLEHARGGGQVVSIITVVDADLTTVSQTSVGSNRPDLMPNDTALRERDQKRAGSR